MSKILRLSVFVVICMVAQIWGMAYGKPFEYLPLAQSARIETGAAILANYVCAAIEPRQEIATGRAWRHKMIVRPSIGWQSSSIGVEAGVKAAASLLYDRIDWSPYAKLGVSLGSLFAVAVLSDLEVKKDSDVVPRVATIASYTVGGGAALYAAGDLTIRDNDRTWGMELGMEKSMGRRLDLLVEGRMVISQYWKSYVAGFGWLIHF